MADALLKLLCVCFVLLTRDVDLCPRGLRPAIDAANALTYHHINNGNKAYTYIMSFCMSASIDFISACGVPDVLRCPCVSWCGCSGVYRVRATGLHIGIRRPSMRGPCALC